MASLARALPDASTVATPKSLKSFALMTLCAPSFVSARSSTSNGTAFCSAAKRSLLSDSVVTPTRCAVLPIASLNATVCMTPATRAVATPAPAIEAAPKAFVTPANPPDSIPARRSRSPIDLPTLLKTELALSCASMSMRAFVTTYMLQQLYDLQPVGHMVDGIIHRPALRCPAAAPDPAVSGPLRQQAQLWLVL